MTHSPTPWKFEPNVSIIDNAGEYVGFLDNFFIKDIEFIITAVNAYEANQALIEQLVEALRESLEAPISTTTRGAQLLAMEAARKAGF